MVILVIFIIVGFYFLLWFATSGQDWIEKRRLRRLPEDERTRIETERFRALMEESTKSVQKRIKEIYERREREKANWSEAKRRREERKENHQREREFEIYQSIKKRDAKYSEKWFLIREEVMKRDKNTCVLCGKKVKYDGHVHHKTSISKGGDHSLENLELLCSFCHTKKHPWL